MKSKCTSLFGVKSRFLSEWHLGSKSLLALKFEEDSSVDWSLVKSFGKWLANGIQWGKCPSHFLGW